MKKHTKMYKTAIATTLATSALVAVVPAQADTVTFKDVDSSNQFYDYITNLANRGIISGYGDDTFRPGLDVRRDHAAKIIAGVLGLDTKNVVDPKFADVPANHPHYGEIAAIKEAGIISGDGYGNYLPEKALTRGEMAKIIANAFKLEVPAGSTTPLTDIKGNMFEQYITALYVNGVTKGTGDNTFKPSDIVTREQLAAFVVRAEEIASKVVAKPTTPGGTSTGGGAGAGSNTGGNDVSLEGTIEEVLEIAVDNYNPNYTYAKAIVDSAKNELKFEIVDGSITLAKVKSDMIAFEAANTVGDILDQITGLGTLYNNLTSITVNGDPTKTYTKAQLLNKDFTKNLIIDFVDDYQGAATTIGELKDKETTVTINFTAGYSALEYKLKIVDEE